MLAIKKHFYFTKSLKFLKEIEFSVVYQSAPFFESCVHFNRTKNACLINNVTPPESTNIR